MENAEAIIDKYLKLVNSNLDNNIFLFTINHLESKYWIDNEFNLEKSLQILPLKSQIPIKTKKRLRDRCMALGNKFLELFGIWLILTQNSWKNEDSSRFTLQNILEKMEFNSHGKPLFDLDAMKQDYKFETENFNFSFSLSNDKESLINSMVIITGNTSGQPLNIGLDLINRELIDRLFINELKDGILHGDELKLLESYEKSKESYEMFFAQLWSLKESYSKYKGTGLIDLDLRTLNFKNVKLIEFPETETMNIELLINGQKQSNLTIITKLLNKKTCYSVVFDQTEPLEKIEMKLIQLDIAQVDIVVKAIACKPMNSKN